MSKKTAPRKEEQLAEPATTVEVSRASERRGGFDPFGSMHVAEWFDRWPEIFARRWPESLQGTSFVDGGVRMEQFTDGDDMVFRCELPGLDPQKDITITVDANDLTIAGHREHRSEEKTDAGFRTEFRYGSFSRTVRLPRGVERDDIEATYSHGILEVRVPMDGEESGTATIPIHTKE